MHIMCKTGTRAIHGSQHMSE